MRTCRSRGTTRRSALAWPILPPILSERDATAPRLGARSTSRALFDRDVIVALRLDAAGHRDRHVEVTTAGRVLVLLLDDLGGEVPRQQQQVVGPIVEQDLDRPDRQPAPGHQLAVLVDVAIDDVGDEVGPDARCVLSSVAPLAAAP